MIEKGHANRLFVVVIFKRVLRQGRYLALDLLNKDFGRLKRRNKMFRDFNCLIPLDMTANFFRSPFDDKAAESPNVDVLPLRERPLDLLKNVSRATSTSTFGTPVFSDIAATRSAFLIVISWFIISYNNILPDLRDANF